MPAALHRVSAAAPRLPTTRSSRWAQRFGCTLALCAGVLACGGGGGPTSPPAPSARVLRELPTALVQRQAVAYSPYRSANRDAEVITDAMVAQDLALLVKAGVGLVRLFDSSDDVAKRVLRVIAAQGLDLKVMLGVWISPQAEAANQAEVARGMALAGQYKDTVLAVSVGNETLVSWTAHKQTTADLARFIAQVRAGVSQPVTTDDNWAVLSGQGSEQSPKAVLDVVDFVAVHTYPLLDSIHNPQLWDWKQAAVPAPSRAGAMMDAAIDRAKFELGAVLAHLKAQGLGHMPALIGETGWKAQPSGGEVQRAHPVNQRMYWQRLQAWKASGTGPANVVHFAAFDEPWKGADDKWGLFNVNRQARCAVQGLSPDFVPEPGSCADAAALFHVPAAAAPAVSAQRYTVWADAATAGEALPSAAVLPNAWENNSTAVAQEMASGGDAADGPRHWRITPKPLDWGWGMAFTLPDAVENLSAFDSATGHLNFSINTTYAGAIEVGFLTGTAANASLYDVYLPISPGQYGYQNDGAWRQVRVPISALKARGAPSYGMKASTLNMAQVGSVLVLADRYAITGKTGAAKGHTTAIGVDAIFWSK